MYGLVSSQIFGGINIPFRDAASKVCRSSGYTVVGGGGGGGLDGAAGPVAKFLLILCTSISAEVLSPGSDLSLASLYSLSMTECYWSEESFPSFVSHHYSDTHIRYREKSSGQATYLFFDQ